MLLNKLFTKKIGGEIALYSLEEWWRGTFTEAEKRHIVTKLYGDGDDYLIKGEANKNSELDGNTWSAAKFLSNKATWFRGPKDRDICRKMLEKAEKLNKGQDGEILSILDQHFILSTKIEVCYRDRHNPEMLKTAIQSCAEQIKIALQAKEEFIKEFRHQELPSHEGFKQLIIILAKQEKYKEAIKFSEEAKKQGWSGDWDKRIDRYSKKLE